MARSFPTRPFRTHDLDDTKSYIETKRGKLLDSMVATGPFATHGGVRQGCVIGPRLFCAMLEMSIANWRDEILHLGLDLGDGRRSLLDLKFPNHIAALG